MTYIDAVFSVVDKYGIVRRTVLVIAIWMTWNVSVWAMSYVMTSSRPGIDLAAIIAAVTAPVTMFATHVFKAYLESRDL